jgi:hypothetical protein
VFLYFGLEECNCPNLSIFNGGLLSFNGA